MTQQSSVVLCVDNSLFVILRCGTCVFCDHIRYDGVFKTIA